MIQFLQNTSAFLLGVAFGLAWLAGGMRLLHWSCTRWGDHFHVAAISWSVYCFVPGLLLVLLGIYL